MLEKVASRYRGRPTTYTDRGPWYIWPAKVLGIRHRRETFGMRNTIEQWFSRLKRRIKQFNIYFPIYKTKTTERWIKAWTAFSLLVVCLNLHLIPWLRGRIVSK